MYGVYSRLANSVQRKTYINDKMDRYKYLLLTAIGSVIFCFSYEDQIDKDYGDISAASLQKCDPKVQKCFKVFKKNNTRLRDENMKLKHEKMQLEKRMEYTAFQCALSAIQRSVKFLYEEVVQKVDEVQRFTASINVGNVHPIISRLASPSKLNVSQKEYLVYKEFLRVIPNYTATPEFFRPRELLLPHFEVAEYLSNHLTTAKLQDEFCATISSVQCMCDNYRQLNESEGIRRFEKNHSIPSLSVALSADDQWTFNEVDLAYVNILRSAVNDYTIDSVKVKDGLLWRDTVLPLADPENGC